MQHGPYSVIRRLPPLRCVILHARNRGRASGSRAGSVCSGRFTTLQCDTIAIACTSRAAAKHELQPNLGPISPNLDTKNLLLQAVGASSISSLRTMTPHGGGGELGVGGSARCAGAYDRTRVRTRVDARAWQGLRRRFKAPSPWSEPSHRPEPSRAHQPASRYLGNFGWGCFGCLACVGRLAVSSGTHVVTGCPGVALRPRPCARGGCPRC